jgi:uncharacterized protein
MSRALFVHGGGDDAFHFDLELEARLQNALGDEVEIEYPRFVGLERIEWQPAFDALSACFAGLEPDSIVVAHSIGGAASLKVLSGARKFPIRNLFLLAAPYKAEDSHWGNDDFTFSSDFPKQLDSALGISIYHSKDDDIIPVDDALLYEAKMPTARVHLLEGYGHQFKGSLDVLTHDIRSAIHRKATPLSP